MILNADCKFCGAYRQFTCEGREDVTRISREWLTLHGPCAKGRDSRVDLTGQEEENAPETPIVTAIIRGRN